MNCLYRRKTKTNSATSSHPSFLKTALRRIWTIASARTLPSEHYLWLPGAARDQNEGIWLQRTAVIGTLRELPRIGGNSDDFSEFRVHRGRRRDLSDGTRVRHSYENRLQHRKNWDESSWRQIGAECLMQHRITQMNKSAA